MYRIFTNDNYGIFECLMNSEFKKNEEYRIIYGCLNHETHCTGIIFPDNTFMLYNEERDYDL